MKTVVQNGFTLIEVIVVLVLMAILVGTAVLNVGRGLKSARLQEAGRVVTQYARHARAVALLKGKPTVLTVEEIREGGEFTKSRISIAFSSAAGAQSGSSLMMAGGQMTGAGALRTLTGRLVSDEGVTEEFAALAAPADTGDAASDGENPLAPEPRTFEGIRVKGMLQENRDEQPRARISVFSNVDFLKRSSAESAAKKESGTSDGKKDSKEEVEESVDEESSFSVVYEVNGRCEPWKVKLWRDGTDEDDALTISFGRFGRVVTPEDR